MNHVADIIVAAAEQHPTRPALLEPNQDPILYSELRVRVRSSVFTTSQEAGQLRFDDIKCVGVVVEEGIQMVMTMLCLYFRGIPFVAVDRRWPAARIRYLIATCGVSHLAGTLSVAMSLESISLSAGDREFESSCRRGEDICYFATTSGTTGMPKVIPVSNNQIIESARCKVNEENINSESIILLASHFTFDPCHVDMISSLIAGSCLVLPSRAAVTSSELPSLVSRMRVTHICCTPTHWRIFTESLQVDVGPDCYPDLKCLSLGGEQFPKDVLHSNWCKSHITVRNTYGLTEAVGYQSSIVMNGLVADSENFKNGFLPIGSGLGSYCISLSSEGEIEITGKYINKIKTGDYGIQSNNGVMISDFRRGSKVKLRGVLIDLSVTEHEIKRGISPFVDLSDIRCFILPDQQVLCCCLCLRRPLTPDAQFHITRLIHLQCSLTLIQQAVPVQCSFVVASSFGQLVGSQSKITDDQIIGIHNSNWGSAVAGDPPSTELQIIIRNAWVMALGRGSDDPSISTSDNFLSLGGDSIVALRVVRYIEEHTSSKASTASGDEDKAFKSMAGMLIDKENRDEQICNLKDIMGAYAPCELISRPILMDYEEYLISMGVVPLDGCNLLLSQSETREERDKLEDTVTFLIVNSLLPEDDEAAESLGPLFSSSSSPRTTLTEWGLLHSCVAYKRPKLFSEIIKSGYYNSEQVRLFSHLGHLAAGRGDVSSLEGILQQVGWCDGQILPAVESDGDDDGAAIRLVDFLRETDNDGCTILHLATRGGSITCVRILIAVAMAVLNEKTLRSYLDQKDNSLMTPIQWGVSNGNFKCTKALVAAGATPLVRNSKPVKPQSTASESIKQTATNDRTDDDYGRVTKGTRKSERYLAHRKVEKDTSILEELIIQLSSADDDVVEESIATIRNLVCAVQTHRRVVLEKEGAIQQIITLLWPPGRIAAHAAGTIRNLSTRVDGRQILLQFNVLPPLVKLLQETPPSQDAAWRAAAAIGSLAANTDTWEYLLSCGAVATIRDMGARKLDLPADLLARIPV